MTSHEEWQAQVIQLTHLYRWDHLHVRRTIGKGKRWVTATNLKGWPDLLLWHVSHGFAAIELKVGADKPTPEQEAVLASLRAAGAVAMVAYPDDLPVVHRLLTGQLGHPAPVP